MSNVWHFKKRIFIFPKPHYCIAIPTPDINAISSLPTVVLSYHNDYLKARSKIIGILTFCLNRTWKARTVERKYNRKSIQLKMIILCNEYWSTFIYSNHWVIEMNGEFGFTVAYSTYIPIRISKSQLKSKVLWSRIGLGNRVWYNVWCFFITIIAHG